MGPVVALDSVAVIVFIGLLLSRRFDDAPPGRFLHWRGNHTLSTLSYSLYAAHTPVVIFLFAVARRLLGPAPSVLALMGELADIGLRIGASMRGPDVRTGRACHRGSPWSSGVGARALVKPPACRCGGSTASLV
mgnify:CR=1 FL=1